MWDYQWIIYCSDSEASYKIPVTTLNTDKNAAPELREILSEMQLKWMMPKKSTPKVMMGAQKRRQKAKELENFIDL